MILSLANLKVLLKITGNDDDAFLKMTMPIIEESICRYCKDDFISNDFDLHTSSDFVFSEVDNSISLINIGDELIAGDTIRIYNSHRNDRALLVKTVSIDKLIIDDDYNFVYPEQENQVIVMSRINYPDDLKLPFIQMMNYVMKNYNVGIKSEKIDDYSISYDELIDGYPKSIMAGLQHHRNLFKQPIYDRSCYDGDI